MVFRIALESGWHLVRALACQLNFRTTAVVPSDASRPITWERCLAFQPLFLTLTSVCAAVQGVRAPQKNGALNSPRLLDRLTQARAEQPRCLMSAHDGVRRRVCCVP